MFSPSPTNHQKTTKQPANNQQTTTKQPSDKTAKIKSPDPGG
jgi:hypothetical protein